MVAQTGAADRHSADPTMPMIDNLLPFAGTTSPAASLLQSVVNGAGTAVSSNVVD